MKLRELLGNTEELRRGKQVVWPYALSSVNDVVVSQMQKGVDKYGHTLETWNGLSPYRMAKEELVDALMYLEQAEMECQDLMDLIVVLVDMLEVNLGEEEFNQLWEMEL